MEVNLMEILKNEGVKKQFLFFETIQETSMEFYGEMIDITKPVKVEGYAINYEGKIRFDMNIQTEIERTCSRCLAAFNEKIDFYADYVFVKSLENQEEDAYLFKGDSISLNEIVIDEIASQMTMKPLCEPDCKGLCPKCGNNKNIDECGCILDEIDPRLEILNSLFEKK